MSVLTATWLSPVTGEPLAADGPHLLRDETGAWPVVDGIPYLRTTRPGLRVAAVTALEDGDVDAARLALLRDRDDWAPDLPLDAAAAAEAPTLRAAMEALGYGPVADYFSYRLSDPTYLSGLALLRMYPARPLFELGCGVGQLLRAAGGPATGADVVWSKLWLARRFVAPDADLVCCDAADRLPVEDRSAAVALCHDALYFLPAKEHVARELRRVAPTVLIGHAHNARVDNLSAGDPLDPDGYAALLDDPVLYDDAELTAACLAGRLPQPGRVRDAAAIALVQGGAPEVPDSAPEDDTPLVRNPLLRADGRIAWPSARYEREYAPGSAHLTGTGDDARERRAIALPDAWGTPAPPLRFGLVGCGWVARDYVAPALRAARHAELAAAYDPAATIPGVDHRATLAELLADVEAVYVATPNDTHAEIVAAAAAAGKAILCEKPMASTLAEARGMAAAVRAAGVPYATAFDQRHHPAHVALANAIRAGRLGTVTGVRIVYCCWVGAGWASDNWRIDPSRAGGGALLDLAPHGLDLVSTLLGEELEAVQALTQRRVHDYAVEDGAMLIARTTGGVLAQLHVAYNHPEDRPRRRLEVTGTRGLAVAIDTLGQDPGGTLTIDGEPVPFDATASPFTRQIDAFAATVLRGETPDLDHDLHLMELLEPWR